jgi:hypothetical protein
VTRPAASAASLPSTPHARIVSPSRTTPAVPPERSTRMNRVPVATEGDGTTAPGRGMIPGGVGAGAAEGRDAGGDTRGAGSREGAPAQPERRRSTATAMLQHRVCGLWAGDTPSRSGRTLLPAVGGHSFPASRGRTRNVPPWQECPPLTGMSPESACTLQLLLPAVLLAEETPLWLVSGRRLTRRVASFHPGAPGSPFSPAA